MDDFGPSRTMSFDADRRLYGKTLPTAVSIAKRYGYDIVVRDRENILNYSWLYEDWHKNVIYVTVRNGHVVGIQRIHSSTANWDGRDAADDYDGFQDTRYDSVLS